MTCPLCGAEKPEDAPCPRCGHPGLPEEAAKALAEAHGLAAAGAIDQSIRAIQRAVKASPESALPHLKLAQAYERKVQGGETALGRLAEREFREALRIAPADREVHISRLGFWARTGRLGFLRAEYRGKGKDLPFAGECLRILDALEQSGTVAGSLDAASGAAALRARYFVATAFGLGAIGLVELSVVVHGALTDDQYVMMGHMDFYVSVGCLTATAILVLEAWRAVKGRK